MATPLSFDGLTTPHLADACLRLGVAVRAAPAGIRPLVTGSRLAGRVLPARHYGSVDVFFEALEGATGEDVLVIDNGGRADEGCIGDLTALEVRSAGVRGIVVWGVHRDTADLREIALPVWSYGSCPLGPSRLDPRDRDALLAVRFGSCVAGREDAVFADDDGVVFLPLAGIDEVLAAAATIRKVEKRQAEGARAGTRMREQLRFAEFLDARGRNPGLTFREHLRRIGGAIEE